MTGARRRTGRGRKRWGLSVVLAGGLAVVAGLGAAAAAQDPEFVVCHKGETRVVSNENTFDAHIAHGDTPGPCPGATETGTVPSRTSRDDDHAARPGGALHACEQARLGADVSR